MLKRLFGFREFALVVVLVLEVFFFAFLQYQRGVALGDTYLDPSTLLKLFHGAVILAVACIGSCLVIIGGGIDLSVAGVIALSSVLTAWVMQQTLGVWGWSDWLAAPSAIATGLAVGGGCGALSGLLVVKVRLQPFVATLAMMSVARGVGLVLTGGQTVRVPGESGVLDWVGGSVAAAGMSIPVMIMVLVGAAAFFTFFMAKFKWGRQIFAIGGNEEAARFCGVRVDRIKVLMYTLAGLLAGLSGVLYVAHHGMGQSSAAPGWELDAIAAVVVGGASLTGGRGSVVGAVLGAVFFRILDTALNGIGYGSWSRIVVGVVLVLVVVFDQIVTSRRSQTV